MVVLGLTFSNWNLRGHERRNYKTLLKKKKQSLFFYLILVTSASIELKPLSPGPKPPERTSHRLSNCFFPLFLSMIFIHTYSSSLMLTNQNMHVVFLFSQHTAHESSQ